MVEKVTLAPAAVPSLDDLVANPTLALGLPPTARSQLLAACAAAIAAFAADSEAASVRVSDAPIVSASTADDWLTVSEAAEILKFAPSYVYEMARRGDFPVFRHKKYVRVRRSALHAWIKEHESSDLDYKINTVLSSGGDRRGSARTPAATTHETDRVRRATRRAPNHSESLGAQHREHPRTDSPTDCAPHREGPSDSEEG